jgi:hypothetical protein
VAGQSRDPLCQEKANMSATRTNFAALAGVLLCWGLVSVTDVLAEDPKAKPETAPASVSEGGKLNGILTHFEYNWTKVHNPKPDLRLSLKAEGETEPVDYLLALPDEAVDPKLEAAMKKVCPSNTVSMEWEMRDGKRLVTDITVLSPTRGQGTISATVMDRGKGYLDLKGADRRAVTTRYAAASPNLAGILESLGIGDRVKIVWTANPERAFVNEVKLVSRAPAKRTAEGSKTDRSKPTEPKP